jgi:hypothetical protein
VSCFSRFRTSQTIKAPCGHIYCNRCLDDLTEASIRDETLFPPRCCKQKFLVNVVLSHLDPKLRPLFRAKEIEFGTPPDDRVYCPRPTCSAFLGALDAAQKKMVCTECHTAVCSSCKNTSHPGEACAENAATIALKELAQAKSWPTCPGCHRIIELAYGCNHITCRCRTEFCYLCEARWKTCHCDVWDERRLFADAEARQVADLGGRAAAAAVEAPRFAAMVRQRVADLRVRHDCGDHVWIYRHGGGMCPLCTDDLPKFLMVCGPVFLHDFIQSSDAVLFVRI